MSALGVPFFPPFSSVMPAQSMDALLNAYGVKLFWLRSHLCACTYSSANPGSPDPQCTQCLGRGWYWDAPYGPFMGLITFMHLSPSPDEPGAIMDEKYGQILRDEPTLTIPQSFAGTLPINDILRDSDVLAEPDIFNLLYSPGAINPVWQNASLNDVFVEQDSNARFEVQLQVGGVQSVPYQWGAAIAPSGAVTVYDQTTHSVVAVSGYAVSGATVTLPGEYPEGTSYIVSYFAQRAYAAWREAGSLPHARPFGAGALLPRRFRLQNLDLWLRNTGTI